MKAIVSEAADFAQTSPEPDPSELWTDVYVEALKTELTWRVPAETA